MKMTKRIVLFALLAALSVFGCRRAKEDAPSSAVQTEAAVRPSRPSDAVSPPEVLSELDAASVALTNYICNASHKAIGECQQMREKIIELPPEIAGPFVNTVVERIMSVQYERLDMYTRSRALRLMLDTAGFSWRDMRRIDVWEQRMRRLSRLREVIDAVRSEKCDEVVKRGFIAYEMDYLRSYSELYEKELAYRTSKEISAKDQTNSVKEMPEEEYAVVKAKFEVFLGHPIRAYEEIVRIQIDRAHQMEVRDQRRLGGPDIQVDTRGL